MKGTTSRVRAVVDRGDDRREERADADEDQLAFWSTSWFTMLRCLGSGMPRVARVDDHRADADQSDREQHDRDVDPNPQRPLRVAVAEAGGAGAGRWSLVITPFAVELLGRSDDQVEIGDLFHAVERIDLVLGERGRARRRSRSHRTCERPWARHVSNRSRTLRGSRPSCTRAY